MQLSQATEPRSGTRTVRLVHGDCLELMSALGDKSIDMIFADPPYFLSNGGVTCQNGTWTSVDKASWDVSAGLHEDREFHVTWLRQCQRVLKDTGTIWISGTQHAIFSIGFTLQELGFHLLNTVCWFKPNASPNLSRRYLTHSHELIIWAAPRKKRPLAHTFNYEQMRLDNGGKQMRDVWRFATPAKWEKLCGKHPTQKPVRLLDRIVRMSTEPGDVVLDPFIGSGTTAVAALVNDRQVIGFDIDASNIDLATRRTEAQEIARVRSRLNNQPNLFSL